jgi:hypothetical protein
MVFSQHTFLHFDIFTKKIFKDYYRFLETFNQTTPDKAKKNVKIFTINIFHILILQPSLPLYSPLFSKRSKSLHPDVQHKLQRNNPLMIVVTTEYTECWPCSLLIFCSISIYPLASLVAGRRPGVMLVQISRECTPPYLSTGISNLLQPAQAEVVLGQLSAYLAFWVVTYTLCCTVECSHTGSSLQLVGLLSPCLSSSKI